MCPALDGRAWVRRHAGWSRGLDFVFSDSSVFRGVAGFKLRQVFPVNGQSREERLFPSCFQSAGEYRREMHYSPAQSG